VRADGAGETPRRAEPQHLLIEGGLISGAAGEVHARPLVAWQALVGDRHDPHHMVLLLLIERTAAGDHEGRTTAT